MSSVGIDRRTGQVLQGWAHVVQSIEDILTTRVMTRVMRRLYGSDTPLLIDAPMNKRSLMAVYSTIAVALLKWEPRFRLARVEYVSASASGQASILLTGSYIPRGHLGDGTPESAALRTIALFAVNDTNTTQWRAAA